MYVSNEPTLNATGATQFLLGTVEHDGIVAAGGSYTAEQTFQLSPEVTGKYVIVATNTGNIVVTEDRIIVTTPTYEGPYTNNNVTAVPAVINRLPPANLQVTSITGQPEAYSGSPLTVTWTVENFGAATWSGTQYWEDDVYLSAFSTLDTNRDTKLGSVIYSNSRRWARCKAIPNPGTFTVPDGIGGTAANPQTYYIYVIADVTGTTQHRNADNDDSLSFYASAAYDGCDEQAGIDHQPVIYREPDLVVSNVIVPTGPVYSNSTIPVTWTVTNTGNRDTPETFLDRPRLSVAFAVAWT